MLMTECLWFLSWVQQCTGRQHSRSKHKERKARGYRELDSGLFAFVLNCSDFVFYSDSEEAEMQVCASALEMQPN